MQLRVALIGHIQRPIYGGFSECEKIQAQHRRALEAEKASGGAQ